MNILLTALTTLLIALPTCSQPKPIGWHGIVPLRSTRADVIRLLGSPNFDGKYYEIDNYIVHCPASNGFSPRVDSASLLLRKGWLPKVICYPTRYCVREGEEIHYFDNQTRVDGSDWRAVPSRGSKSQEGDLRRVRQGDWLPSQARYSSP